MKLKNLITTLFIVMIMISCTDKKSTKQEEVITEKTLAGFNKTLTLQGITFKIHATKQGSMNTLTIQPAGLEIENREVVHEIDGTVTNAEIEDLNSDGSPEILVYITSVAVAQLRNRSK